MLSHLSPGFLVNSLPYSSYLTYSGSFYLGPLDANYKPIGQGIFIFSDGSILNGIFKNGLSNGLSLFKSRDGLSIISYFKDGKLNGNTCLFNPDLNQHFFCVFEEGEMVSREEIIEGPPKHLPSGEGEGSLDDFAQMLEKIGSQAEKSFVYKIFSDGGFYIGEVVNSSSQIHRKEDQNLSNDQLEIADSIKNLEKIESNGKIINDDNPKDIDEEKLNITASNGFSSIPDGLGVFQFPDGKMHRGRYRNGVPDGPCFIEFENGDYAIGFMNSGSWLTKQILAKEILYNPIDLENHIKSLLVNQMKEIEYKSEAIELVNQVVMEFWTLNKSIWSLVPRRKTTSIPQMIKDSLIDIPVPLSQTLKNLPMNNAPIKVRISLVDQKYRLKKKKEGELNSNETQTFSVPIPKNEFNQNSQIQNKDLPFFKNKLQTHLTQTCSSNQKNGFTQPFSKEIQSRGNKTLQKDANLIRKSTKQILSQINQPNDFWCESNSDNSFKKENDSKELPLTQFNHKKIDKTLKKEVDPKSEEIDQTLSQINPPNDSCCRPKREDSFKNELNFKNKGEYLSLEKQNEDPLAETPGFLKAFEGGWGEVRGVHRSNSGNRLDTNKGKLGLRKATDYEKWLTPSKKSTISERSLKTSQNTQKKTPAPTTEDKKTEKKNKMSLNSPPPFGTLPPPLFSNGKTSVQPPPSSLIPPFPSSYGPPPSSILPTSPSLIMSPRSSGYPPNSSFLPHSLLSPIKSNEFYIDEEIEKLLEEANDLEEELGLNEKRKSLGESSKLRNDNILEGLTKKEGINFKLLEEQCKK